MISIINSSGILDKFNSILMYREIKQHTLREDFNVWPASFRTSSDVVGLAAKTERQTPSQVKLWTAFGTIPRGIFKKNSNSFFFFYRESIENFTL